MLNKRKHGDFPFTKNDVVLARYEREVFYAKIMAVNYRRKFAKLLFDDGSSEDIPFKDIFNVNETTSDIICVICKKDSTEVDNDIVLCDQCDIGYHQKCHEPVIPSDVLKPEIPWECCYCLSKIKNPHVETNPFEETEMEIEETKESEETKTCQKEFEKLKVAEEDKLEENDSSTKSVAENQSKSSNTSDHTKPSQPSKDEAAMYGEQVVIAHADSTSSDKSEDLIIDVESDENVRVFEMQQSHSDQIELKSTNKESNEGMLKVYETGKVIDRFSKDLPKHNWLIDRLRIEKKLQDSEIKQIEQTVFSSQRENKSQNEYGYLKRYLEEKSLNSRTIKSVTSTETQHLTNLNRTIQKSREKLQSQRKSQPDSNNNTLKISHAFNHSCVPTSHQSISANEDYQYDFQERSPVSIHDYRHLSPEDYQQKCHQSMLHRQLSDMTSNSLYGSFHLRQEENQRISPIESPSKISMHTNQQKRTYRSSTAPCKTQIYRPEDIEKCLKNIFPSTKHAQNSLSMNQTIHQHQANTNFVPSIRINDHKIHSHSLDRNETSYRYQPYATYATNNRRFRNHSDSTMHYLSTEDAFRYPSVEFRSSEDGFQYNKRSSSVSSSIPSIPSPGYETNNVFQKKEQLKHRRDTRSPKKHRCLSCGRVAQLLCSGCRNVRYCSRECQLDDWREHQILCSIDDEFKSI